MKIKLLLKAMLMRLGLYEQVRFSHLFKLYARFFKKGLVEETIRETKFYALFLKPCPLIFDVGAYDGHKAEVFLRFAEKVVCCEPDTKNYRLLAIRFRNEKDRIYLENKAIGSTEGEVQMFLPYEGSAFNTLNTKFKSIIEKDRLNRWNEVIKYEHQVSVPVTTLNQLILKYGVPYFIKIDVEGYEVSVVRGLNYCIPFISIECLFPEFEEELYAIIEHLETITAKLKFNIAVDESLVFQAFKEKQELLQYLKKQPLTHFETIINMIP